MPDGIPVEVDGHVLALTHLDRPLYAGGFAKAEVIDYYARVAPVLLPHLADRCLTRRRFPHGTDAEGFATAFYEKNVPPATPGWVRVQRVLAEQDVIDYPVATGPADLVWLANLAALELHTPAWRTADTITPDTTAPDPDAPDPDPDTTAPDPDVPAQPDAGDNPAGDGGGTVIDLVDTRSTTLVVDLDPGPGVPRAELAHSALLVASRLAADGLVPLVKTSGNKGLQLMAAIEPAPASACVQYVQRLAKRLAIEHPDRFVATMARQQRTGRVFVDYLQNEAARNTVSVYSLRGGELPSVSTPVTWDEVDAVRSDADLRFTAPDVLERIERHGDLWAELLDPAARGPLPG